MPRSTREWALRKLSASQNNIDWCMKHLIEVADRYAEAHPKIAEELLNNLQLGEILKHSIDITRGKI